jgi:phosphoserine phosphatase
LTIIKRIESSLGEFSRLTVELDRKNDDMVTKITSQEINSNATRDKFFGEWVSDIDSMKAMNLKQYIDSYTKINSNLDNLMNYLEDEMERELLA